MQYCEQCGNALVEGARFCTRCGNPVPSVSTTVPPLAPSCGYAPARSADDAARLSAIDPANKSKRAGKGRLIAAISLGVVLILAVAATLVINNLTADKDREIGRCPSGPELTTIAKGHYSGSGLRVHDIECVGNLAVGTAEIEDQPGMSAILIADYSGGNWSLYDLGTGGLEPSDEHCEMLRQTRYAHYCRQ